MKLIIYIVFSCLISLSCGLSVAVELPGVADFIEEMVEKHQFDRAELTVLFAQAKYKPQIIEAISRPSTIKPWQEYRAAFVNSSRISHGLAFWQKYRVSLCRAEKQYDVPQAVIVALIGVETMYGQNMGEFRTIDALTTLAFDYPRRAKFFREELENYLLLAREQHYHDLEIKGSYAGALGIPQFMPSSYRKYAVDFNGNQTINLMNEPADAIGSVGNYLKSYGWLKGGLIAMRAQVAGNCCDNNKARSLAEWGIAGVMSEVKINRDEPARLLDFTLADGKEYWLGFNNFDVITRYNNSDYYAMSVFQLAEALDAAHKTALEAAHKSATKSPHKAKRKMSFQKTHKTSKMTTR